MVAYLQIDFVCPTCGAEGYGMWRPDAHAHHSRWELIGTSQDFHGEPSQTLSRSPEVTCNGCENVLSD